VRRALDAAGVELIAENGGSPGREIEEGRGGEVIASCQDKIVTETFRKNSRST
jgi:hypothetical protein